MKTICKMGMPLTLTILCALLGYHALRPASVVSSVPHAIFPNDMLATKFPVLPRFEMTRNFGFMIGDIIPLNLIIETVDGVIVNLEKLPQKGQRHGAFEIRDMQIRQKKKSNPGSIYQVAYTLQYFGPTPRSVKMEGMQILYAHVDDRTTTGDRHTYKTLFTQPLWINMSRLSPLHHTALKPLKGAIRDERQLSFWLGGLFSICCLAVGSVRLMLVWKQRTHIQRRMNVTTPISEEPSIRVIIDNVHDMPAGYMERATLVQSLCHLLKEYVQTAYHLPAHILTTNELIKQLAQLPNSQHLVALFKEIDAMQDCVPIRSHKQHQTEWRKTTKRNEHLRKVKIS